MNNILERDKTQLLNGARTLQEYYKEDLEEFYVMRLFILKHI